MMGFALVLCVHAAHGRAEWDLEVQHSIFKLCNKSP